MTMKSVSGSAVSNNRVSASGVSNNDREDDESSSEEEIPGEQLMETFRFIAGVHKKDRH